MTKIKRDSKGRFVKGASGNPAKKFTSTRQPKNAGRKPSRFKQIIAQLEDIDAEPLSREDYDKIVTHLLTLTPTELTKLANSKEAPMAVLVVASAISGDIENKNLGNIDRMLDRVFGRAVSKQEITGKDGKDLILEPIKIEIIDNREQVNNANDSDDKDI